MVQITKFVTVTVIAVLVLALGTMSPVTQPVSAAIGVLFDTGHQTGASNMLGYYDMTTDLTSRGFSFNEDNDGNITEADLSGSHILVMVRPGIPLSDLEISNIRNFVAAGHGFLLLSDGLDGSAMSSVNTLLDPYGIQQSTMPTLSGIYTDITNHDITKGVSQYDQDSQGCEFSIGGSPALSLIRDTAGRTLVAASHVSGRVVVVSDQYSFHLNSYNNCDNSVLMRNIFNWLSNVENPIANFSAQPVTGEGLLNVHFTDESTGDIDNWHWDFGDGAASNQQNPIHTYDYIGRYTVSLKVTGAGGTDIEEKQGYIHVTDVPGRVAEVKPTGLVTSCIRVEPGQVLPHEGVKISINVTNGSDTEGSYETILNINGKLEDSQVIDVSPGSSQTVVFDVTKTKPGTYEVSIDGHKVQFVVTGSTPSSVTTGDGLGTSTIIAIILGSVLAAIAIVFVARRRRHPATSRNIEEKLRKLLDELEKT